MKQILILAVVMVATIYFEANGAQPTYIHEMGPFEAVRRIKYLAARYDITTDEVQRIDYAFEKKGAAWDEFSRDDIAVLVQMMRNGGKDSPDAAAKKAKLDAEQERAAKEAQERKEKEERLAKLKAEVALKAKAEATARALAAIEKKNAALLAWQKERAERGEASAQYELGMRYLNGEGVTNNPALAHEWLSKAAAQGHAKAKAAMQKQLWPMPESK